MTSSRVLAVGSYVAFFVAVINAGAWFAAAFFSDDSLRALAYGGMTLGAFGLALAFQVVVKLWAVQRRLDALEKAREAA